MSKKNIWIISMVLAAVPLIIFTAFSVSEQKEEKEQKKVLKPVTYPTASVQFINPEYEISLPAELIPYEQVAVYARVTGFVKQLYVDRGDHVRKGQPLAILEAPEMEQQYLSDKSTEQKVHNDYLYVKQAYERLVEASSTTGAVAAIELERAKSAMESAKSAYEASKAGTAHSSQLQQYLSITAPFDGVITDRNVSVGALAGTGSKPPLFMMAQDNKLRLTLSLPEKHASSVKEDMRASFTVSSQPGKIFDAVLSRTSGMLDKQDHSLKLEFDVDNSSGALQGGDYAQVKLRLQRKKPSHWVPSKSVLNTQSGTYIMTLNNNEISRVPIQEGIRLDSLSEVFGNLSPEDSVILKPSEEIQEGQIEKTWCPPCIAEMPSIAKLHSEFRNNDKIMFLMVDVDNNRAKSEKFMDKRKFDLPVYTPAGPVPASYLGGAIPTTLVLNKDGNVVFKHEGMSDFSDGEFKSFLTKLTAE